MSTGSPCNLYLNLCDSKDLILYLSQGYSSSSGEHFITAYSLLSSGRRPVRAHGKDIKKKRRWDDQHYTQ